MKKRQTVEQWIREALTDDEKDKECSAVALVHKNNGMDEEIYTIKLNAGRAWAPEDMADVFRHKAEGFSQDLIGVQTFCLLAFYGGSEPQARFPFVLQGRLSYDADGFGTEQPNESGKTQQNMRLTEAIVQGSFRERLYTFDTMSKVIDQLSNFSARTVKQNEELLDTLKVLIVEKATNNHAFTIEQMKMQRENVMLSEGMKLLPPVLNRLTGKEVFPQSTSDTALIEALVDSLTPDMVEKLSSTLPPSVWALVGQRVAEVLEKKNKNGNGHVGLIEKQ
jgi:hypothetical protein